MGFFLTNKGRRESGAPKPTKICVFGLKNQLFRQMKTKDSRLEKLDIGGSIIDTFQGCENVRDLSF